MEKNQLSQVLPSSNDDEIDLVELIVELWGGNKIILLFIFLGLLIGISYIKAFPERFILYSSFSVNLHSVDDYRFCDVNRGCLDRAILEKYSAFLPEWSVDEKKQIISKGLSFIPHSVSPFLTEIESANERLTLLLLDNAKENLRLASGLSPDLLNTDAIAGIVWHSKKVVDLVEQKKLKALSFGGLSVEKQSPKVALVMALSVLLGVTLGILFVLLRKPFIELKSRLKINE